MRPFLTLAVILFSGFLGACAGTPEGEAPSSSSAMQGGKGKAPGDTAATPADPGATTDGDSSGNPADGAGPAAPPTSDEVDQFWKHYAAKDDDDIAADWKSDNEGRAWGGDYLAWHESFTEEALVDMYVATKDPKFVDEAMKRMDVVFSLRDDAINRKDEVRGKVVPAWGRFPDVGTTVRTGTWVSEMVQNGLIAYPIAELASIVAKDPALAAYAPKAAQYRDALVATADAFDDDWDASGDGFYRFPKGYEKVYAPNAGQYLPFNRALVMGKTMMALVDTDIPDAKKQKYKQRVRSMAAFFLNRASKVDGDTRIVWNYATWAPTIEDTAHGGLDTSFFALAGLRDYANVGKADMDRFLNTFRKITHDDKQLLGSLNDPEGADKKDANEACGRYLDLAAYDAALANRCATVFANGDDYHQHGLAKMLRWR